MNDHNLDDLIIDNIAPKSSKTKSLLTVVALFIVVLIVGIILTSVLFDDSKKDQDLVTDTESEMISPELTLQNAATVKEPEAEPKLNEIIEEELNKPVKVSKKTEKTMVAAPVAVEAIKPKVVEVSETKPEPVVTETKEPEEKSVSTTDEIKQTEKKVIASKPVATSVAKKEKVSPKPIAKGNFYIQVGAYKNSPSTRLISSIKNNGFNHTVAKRNGMNKVLIGPFTNRSSANSALIRVKDHINKQAFVVTK